MTGALLDLVPGLADPERDAQATFRVLMDAMARPGTLHTLPAAAAQGVGRPFDRQGRPLPAGLALLLLTLLDADTTLSGHGELASGAVRAWVRFHSGARELAAHELAPRELATHELATHELATHALGWHERAAGAPSAAEPPRSHFVLASAGALEGDGLAAVLQSLPLGSDEQPEQGGTLLLAVEALGEAASAPEATGSPRQALTLSGPGIKHRNVLQVAGVPAAFWQYRQALQADFPRGFELIMVCGDTLAALPRSCRIELPEASAGAR